MNILRHKKWHVRTKENVARVRRDEAKAAEEEKQRAERATIADNEDRIKRLKTRTTAAHQLDDVFCSATSGSSTNKNDDIGIGDGKHVNLFAELEEQERTNFATGNKEYVAEKKKEQDDWESKVGIMKRFAEDTKEYSKESEWWQEIPMVREKVEKLERKEKSNQGKFLSKEEKKAKKEEKRRKKREKWRKKRKRRHGSSPGSDSNNSTDLEKRKKIETLRRERLTRERQEQMRTQKLFEPHKKEDGNDAKKGTGKSQIEEDRKRKYNSQFNPEYSTY